MQSSLQTKRTVAAVVIAFGVIAIALSMTASKTHKPATATPTATPTGTIEQRYASLYEGGSGDLTAEGSGKTQIAQDTSPLSDIASSDTFLRNVISNAQAYNDGELSSEEFAAEQQALMRNQVAQILAPYNDLGVTIPVSEDNSRQNKEEYLSFIGALNPATKEERDVLANPDTAAARFYATIDSIIKGHEYMFAELEKHPAPSDWHQLITDGVKATQKQYLAYVLLLASENNPLLLEAASSRLVTASDEYDTAMERFLAHITQEGYQ